MEFSRLINRFYILASDILVRTDALVDRLVGDNVNITAHLASQAAPGEILISEATYAAAGLDLGEVERRQLALKGKNEPFGVRILRIA